MGRGLVEIAGRAKGRAARPRRTRQRAAEIERRLVGLEAFARVEPQPRARRVVRGEQARRERRAARRRGVDERDAERPLRSVSRGIAPGRSSLRPPAEAGDDRRFDADAAPGRRRGSASMRPSRSASDMGGGRRADAAGAIGRRRGERPPAAAISAARSDASGARSAERSSSPARASRQTLATRRGRRDERQRPRPERLGEPARRNRRSRLRAPRPLAPATWAISGLNVGRPLAA